MKDYMKLATNKQVTIEGAAYLGKIIHIAEDEAGAVEVCAAVTPEALKHVEFCDGDTGEVFGTFDNLVKMEEPMRRTNSNGSVTVVISLREKTGAEIRLDAIEEEQEIQNEAIDYLAME